MSSLTLRIAPLGPLVVGLLVALILSVVAVVALLVRLASAPTHGQAELVLLHGQVEALGRQVDALKRTVSLDPVTMLQRARVLEQQVLPAALRTGAELAQPVTVALIELDGLAHEDDDPKAAAILRGAAAAIHSVLCTHRCIDQAFRSFRVGFAVLLPGVNEGRAKHILTAIHLALRAQHLSATIGGLTIPPGAGVNAVSALILADRHRERAQLAGGDRVSVELFR